MRASMVWLSPIAARAARIRGAHSYLRLAEALGVTAQYLVLGED
jgi:hypothetical protein